jgi:hypothetical protein
MAAVVSPFLPVSLEKGQIDEVVLANGDSLALLGPVSEDEVRRVLRVSTAGMELLACSGAVLETNNGPIRLRRQEFSSLRVFGDMHVDITWRVSFGRYGRSIVEEDPPVPPRVSSG